MCGDNVKVIEWVFVALNHFFSKYGVFRMIEHEIRRIIL